MPQMLLKSTCTEKRVLHMASWLEDSKHIYTEMTFFSVVEKTILNELLYQCS